MEIQAYEVNGLVFLEGPPGQALLGHAEAVRQLLEVCFEHGARGVLLYPENLPPRFFDLSSGDAGEILQKLRNYRVALALVRTPDLVLNTRFRELLLDEQRGRHFGLFDDRAAAMAWLTQNASA